MLQLSILTPSLLLSTFDSLLFHLHPSLLLHLLPHVLASHACLSLFFPVFGSHLKVPREVLSPSPSFSINSCSHDWEKDEKDGNRKERMRDRWEERRQFKSQERKWRQTYNQDKKEKRKERERKRREYAFSSTPFFRVWQSLDFVCFRRRRITSTERPGGIDRKSFLICQNQDQVWLILFMKSRSCSIRFRGRKLWLDSDANKGSSWLVSQAFKMPEKEKQEKSYQREEIKSRRDQRRDMYVQSIPLYVTWSIEGRRCEVWSEDRLSQTKRQEKAEEIPPKSFG